MQPDAAADAVAWHADWQATTTRSACSILAQSCKGTASRSYHVATATPIFTIMHTTALCATATPPYLVQQSNLALCAEQRLPVEHLHKNAAHTPHVDGAAVAADAKQQLWRAVPQCDDLVCVGLEGWQEAAREPKVRNLDLQARSSVRRQNTD
jgi:hypothetical protein